MIEIELKFNINDPKQIKNKLLSLNFDQKHARHFEKTVMYDNTQKLMQQTDGRIRLRKTDVACTLSYKKPISRNGIKKEIEYEVGVTSYDQTDNIIRSMGYSPVSSYEKFRHTFIKKSVIATIDEYPFATFLELEGDENEITNTAKELDFDINDNITDSCDTLFVNWRRSNGLDPKLHMEFDGYDK